MPHRLSAPVRQRRRLVAWLRYVAALARRFRVTLAAAAALFGVAPLVYVALYRTPDGHGIAFGQALHHVYFLLFGEPSLPYVGNFWLELLNLLIPPFGVAVVVDGAVRFGLLAISHQQHDKEWIEVTTRMYENHVIVGGAGRVGYRVAMQIHALGLDVVAIDKREDATYVAALRDLGIPVLIEDIRGRHALDRTNAARAQAIVAATDDDLANLNAALDARRLNPAIRVVMRLFDDDLADTMQKSLRAEAVSSSAVAAPVMALAAIDPRIQHSFRVNDHLMVVSDFVAGDVLAARTLGKVRDEFGALVLAIRGLDGLERLHPAEATPIAKGDVLTIQSEYADYRRLREHTGEATPP